ncbi:acetyltransferase, GNAT family [Lysobacter capsici AZ78]|uniref:Acetyltransferase, GNAT family n=2 Tax=Lysobacter capsici TaxID=435897 RepID=A0A108U6E3_9GAMM|nr:acetyltransferase, GNAT family [Lysobacter capsici AZ78]
MMTIPDIQLETPRLILRPPRLEDFDAWAEFMADAEHVRYVGGAQSRPLAWRAMMSVIGSWAVQGFAFFSVIEKSSGRWIGRLGPWCPEGWPGTEVGWGIVASENGKGYASEGSAAAMEWAFEHLGWREIIHTIDVENLGSKAVAAKLGSRYLRQGRFLPEPHNEKEVEVWGQTVEQWRARRKVGASV